MSELDRYPTKVFWSDEDGGYIALATDLTGCSAFGETQEQALSELRDAMSAWVEAARAAGNPIPERSVPVELSKFSGRFLLRMPRDLHSNLALRSQSEGVSLNQYIVYLLTKASVVDPASTLGRLVKPAKARAG